MPRQDVLRHGMKCVSSATNVGFNCEPTNSGVCDPLSCVTGDRMLLIITGDRDLPVGVAVAVAMINAS